MKNKTLIVGLIAVLVATGAFLIVNNNDSENSNDAVVQNTSETESIPIETSQPIEELPAQTVEEIALLGVEGNTGSGIATRTVDGKYVHNVTAELADPATGKFYEGWIVVDSSDFISTGELVKESEGQWSLTYTSDSDLSNYKDVVITEETSANGLDNKPEDHILEGSF
jgi:hypothetical protein